MTSQRVGVQVWFTFSLIQVNSRTVLTKRIVGVALETLSSALEKAFDALQALLDYTLACWEGAIAELQLVVVHEVLLDGVLALLNSRRYCRRVGQHLGGRLVETAVRVRLGLVLRVRHLKHLAFSVTS